MAAKIQDKWASSKVSMGHSQVGSLGPFSFYAVSTKIDIALMKLDKPCVGGEIRFNYLSNHIYIEEICWLGRTSLGN